MARSIGEENSHGSPLQPVIAATRTLHGIDAHDILQANAEQATLSFPVSCLFHLFVE